MKISIKNYLTMAALTLAGAIMTGCSGSDDGIDTPPQPENTGKVVTLTTTVSLDGGGADTRALTAGGVKTFAAGETMALVYRSMSKKWAVKESEPLGAGDITNDGKSATFTFNLTEEPDKTQSVDYIYPAAMATADGNENDEALCTEQDGTLAKLASNFDLATTHNNLDWDGDNLPGATLENQLAILAITLKDDATDADITGSITGLTLTTRNYSHTESMTYNITRSAAAGPIYVAIHPTRNATIDVTATDGAYTYTKTLEGKVYQASKGYNVSWKMMPPMNTVPLTMEALTAGTIKINNPRPNMQYSKNSGAKTTMTETTTIDVEAGDKVRFYGNSAAYYSNKEDFTSITGSGDGFKCKVYGNIMSLMDETGYATATTLTAENENTFRRLFYNNTKLTNASGLLLPATTLAQGCYDGMFDGCSGLTDAPALPATTLATSCYNGMFSGCSSLTDAPALPATALATGCYNGMFSGCSSLTTAPALNAEELAQGCYYCMFFGCTSLTAAPVLPATKLANNCYQGMFDGCTSLTAAPALPATKLAPNCYFAMFENCTSLTTAPALPATKLATGCYQMMFKGCTSLTTAPALPAKTLAQGCYNRMFMDCISLTTVPAELPATTLETDCYQYMFAGCTGLTTAPTLPAEKLVESCYQFMFAGCSSLSAVTCLATNINAKNCTKDWLNGVAASGTFTKAASMIYWTTGADGIPNGWTRVNYVAPTE